MTPNIQEYLSLKQGCFYHLPSSTSALKVHSAQPPYKRRDKILLAKSMTLKLYRYNFKGSTATIFTFSPILMGLNSQWKEFRQTISSNICVGRFRILGGGGGKVQNIGWGARGRGQFPAGT